MHIYNLVTKQYFSVSCINNPKLTDTYFKYTCYIYTQICIFLMLLVRVWQL